MWEEFGVAMKWPLVGFKVILPNYIATQEGMSSNFRDITLLSLFNKVYARVLERFVISVQEQMCGHILVTEHWMNSISYQQYLRVFESFLKHVDLKQRI